MVVKIMDKKTLKLDSVLTASSNIKSFVENNGRLPNYVTIEDQKYSMDHYLYMSSSIIASEGIGTLNRLTLEKDPKYYVNAVKQSDKPVPRTIKADIDKKTFYDMAGRTSNYITKNKKAPSFVSSKYGDVQFQSTVYAWAKILDYYKKNKVMPNYVSLNVAKTSELANYVPVFSLNTGKFTKKVTHGNETFYIPENYKLHEKERYSGHKYYAYTNGNDYICIEFLPGFTLNELLSHHKKDSQYSNIKEKITYNGCTGYTAVYTTTDYVTNVFIFKKNGKTFVIQIDKKLNFKECITKIIG